MFPPPVTMVQARVFYTHVHVYKRHDDVSCALWAFSDANHMYSIRKITVMGLEPVSMYNARGMCDGKLVSEGDA